MRLNSGMRKSRDSRDMQGTKADAIVMAYSDRWTTSELYCCDTPSRAFSRRVGQLSADVLRHWAGRDQRKYCRTPWYGAAASSWCSSSVSFGCLVDDLGVPQALPARLVSLFRYEGFPVQGGSPIFGVAHDLHRTFSGGGREPQSQGSPAGSF